MAAERKLNLRQQIINDRVDGLADHFGIETDEAFMRLSYSLITGRSIHDFDPLDIVDGGQDKQLDVISIDEESDFANVYVIQTKFTTTFSSNALVQLANGLKWLFHRTRGDISTLSNIALRDKILEYRTLQKTLGPSNIRVIVRFVTNGLTAVLSDEFRQEMKAITSDYSTDTFEDFSLEAIGSDELTDLSRLQERQNRKVDADIAIRYDTNNPSLIKFYSKDLKGLICSVPAYEIARLVNKNPDGSTFDMNIRRFLGTRGAVNREIQNTCTNPQDSHEFWFLNNGITIVCDKFDPVPDPDNPHVKVQNLQIVNGCQTATTLALADEQGRMAQDVWVLTRIYETTDPSLVSRIVLTTNNQNRITSRDLRANDPVQIDMERAFGIYGYAYERKPAQFEGQSISIEKVFTNEYIGQAYLAVVLKNPSDGRARKYKVWGEFQSTIFCGGAVEPYIIAALLSRRASEWLRCYVSASDETERIVAKKGSFHVARMVAFLWRGDDVWRLSQERLKQQIVTLESSPKEVQSQMLKAFKMLVKLIKSEEEYASDVDRALKSGALDRDIDKILQKSRQRSTKRR